MWLTEYRRQLAGFFAALLVVVALVLAAAFGPEPNRQQLRVLFVAANGSVEKITRGLDTLYQQQPELAARLDVRVLAPSSFYQENGLPPHEALIVETMDGSWVSSMAPLLQQSDVSQRLALGASGLHDNPALPEQLGLVRDDTVEQYWENSAPGEIAELFTYYAARYLGVDNLSPEPPQEMLSQGYLYFDEPEADGTSGEVHRVRSWQQWLDAHPDTDKTRIGILEYATRARSEGLGLTRAVAASLQSKGYQPVIVFGMRASPSVRELLFDESGEARVESLISFHHKFYEEAGAETLGDLDIPVINAISVAGRTVDEWQQSVQGLTSGEIARQLAIPELSGLAPPNVVGAIDNAVSSINLAPIPDRVERVADRAIAYATLRNRPIAEHRVGILYWNYPPGKQNVGASYLNVVQSIPLMLRRMQQAGYTMPGLDEKDNDSISEQIVANGLNIGRFAPGELAALIERGDIVSITLDDYRVWFESLPETFQREVIATWGDPEDADIMTTEVDGEMQLIIPVIQFGNVVVLPQPDRARMQNLEALYQSQELPPHHQYLAAYLWLQHEFEANALVHTGTHGTHEWMSGKESGLAGDDAGEVLAGDLPIIYPYIVDDVGEGIVAKRRGMSTVVDHLTPALGTGDLAPELLNIRALLEQWRTTRSTEPESAADIARQIDQEVVTRGLVLDLQDRGWDDNEQVNDISDDNVGTEATASADQNGGRASTEDRFAVLEDYLAQIQQQNIPLGLHTFGTEPEPDRLVRFTDAIVKANGENTRTTAEQRLLDSAEGEMGGLLTGLAGHFVRPGPGNDPIRNLDVIPTGKNFMTFDPRNIPMPSSDEIGRQMAEELIATHQQANGEHPDKIALQLWGVETLRHQGVQEAQGLALLGVRPVRSSNGRIDSLELIPREELGRPRVDVVFHATSLYRDTFPMLFELIDQAVKLAASSPEADNPIRRHAEALQETLIAEGMSVEQAEIQSLLRIFAEPSGKHDSKVHAMTHASGSWDEEAQVAENYIRRMGHGFGEGAWGVSAQSAFRDALQDTDLIVHSRTSSLYATLDNDDYFSYGGSIALGVRRANGGGPSPDFYVSDLRRTGEERHETLERFMGQELRSRYLNPEFAQEMMREGYAGARHVWKATDYLWGWQVVYPEAVDAAKWQEMYEVWMDDRYELGLEEYFEENSPYARQGIAARMLETIRKGYWDAPDDVQRHLTQVYVDSIAQHGPSCDHLSCDNPELQVFVQESASELGGVGEAQLQQAMEAIETATQVSIEEALTQRVADRERWHQPPAEETQEESSQADNSVTGYQMEEEVTEHSQQQSEVVQPDWQALMAPLVLMLILVSSFLSGALRYRRSYRFA